MEDVLVYELVVFFPTNAFVPPSLVMWDWLNVNVHEMRLTKAYHIERVVQEFLVICSDVKGNGEGLGWVYAGNQPVWA